MASRLNLPSKLTLVNADSTKEIPEIPYNSVDLIVTDPPYMKEYIFEESVYDGLARLAARKLKDGGSLVFYYNTVFEPEIHEIFKNTKRNGSIIGIGSM